MISVDNAVLDISDAEMSAKCLGTVTFAAADYKTLNLNTVASLTAQNLMIESTGASIYAIILSGGTPTYTSTTDLTLKFGFRY